MTIGTSREAWHRAIAVGRALLVTTWIFLAALGRAQSPAVPSPLFRALEEPLAADAGTPLAAADFDGDGDQDLLCTSGVHLNSGRGRFRPLAGSLALPIDHAFAIHTGDIDGNGTRDLVSQRGFYWTPLQIWSNAGSASFVAVPQTVSVPYPSYATAAAQGDVDGDGDLDVVVAIATTGGAIHSSYPGPPRLWLNDGSGLFVDASSLLPAIPCVARSLLIIDVDTDGDQDIVALGGGLTTNRVVLLNTAGTFAVGVTPLGAGPPIWRACTGDFDGDGFQDIALTRASGTLGFEVHLTRPGAAFASAFTPSGIGTTYQMFGMDCDGDGRDDLVTCDPGALGIIRLVTSSGVVGPPVGSIAQPYGSPVAADVDGDGDLDLVNGAIRPTVHLNTSQSGFLESPSPLDIGMMSVRSGDVEGDGNPDIVGSAPSSAPLMVTAFNDGNGQFRSGPGFPPFPSLFSYRDWAILDIDGDGDRDLFRADSLTGNDDFVRNAGTSWTPGPSFSASGNAWTANATDLDLDGDLDVAVARSGSGTNSLVVASTLHFNNSGGNTWLHVALPGADVWSSDLAAADADGDGDLDIFVASAPMPPGIPSQSAIYRRTPSGSYLRDAGFAAPPGVGVAAADLDGDGDTDCVFGGQVLRNVGGAVFTPAGSLAGGDPGRLAVADLDGDGDPDLVSAFAWFANLGGLAFAPAEPLESAWAPIAGPLAPPRREWPRAPDVFDLDRDGDLDVVAPNGRIFFNLRSQLARGDLAAPGRLASLEVWGPPGSPFVLAAAAAPAAIPFGPAGLLLLEPSTIGFLTTGMLSPGGAAVFAAMVPAVPAYAGATLYWQAWVAASNRLSNLEPMTVLAP